MLEGEYREANHVHHLSFVKELPGPVHRVVHGGARTSQGHLRTHLLVGTARPVEEVPLLVHKVIPPHLKGLGMGLGARLLLLMGNALHLLQQRVHAKRLWRGCHSTSLGQELVHKVLRGARTGSSGQICNPGESFVFSGIVTRQLCAHPHQLVRSSTLAVHEVAQGHQCRDLRGNGENKMKIKLPDKSSGTADSKVQRNAIYSVVVIVVVGITVTVFAVVQFLPLKWK